MQLVKNIFMLGLVVCTYIFTCKGMDALGSDQQQAIEQGEQELGFMDLWLSYQKGQNILAIVQNNPNWLTCIQNELIDTQNLIVGCVNEIASYQEQIDIAQEQQTITLLQDKLAVSQGMLTSLQGNLNTIENMQSAIATAQANTTPSQM
jgi:hypothetical protein